MPTSPQGFTNKTVIIMKEDKPDKRVTARLLLDHKKFQTKEHKKQRPQSLLSKH